MAKTSSVDEYDFVSPVLIVVCTIFLFYFVWGAMHDIAHGDEGTLEWSVLAICAVAFPWLYWWAIRTLTRTAKLAWLIGTGLLITLFATGAVSSMAHPKYPKDPMLAVTFLIAGVPVLALIGYHLVCELRRFKARREFYGS